jgi:toxin YoeB
MNVFFTQHAWEDFSHWMQADPVKSEKIVSLIDSLRTDPFKGEGKPEPLKGSLSGYWSRRISGEDRLVYMVSGRRGVDQVVTVIQCRFHYDQY